MIIYDPRVITVAILTLNKVSFELIEHWMTYFSFAGHSNSLEN
jgi:hypothetical protein